VNSKTNPTASRCTVQLTIDETIPGPVYIYYQLDNFYQNHRRYVKSRDYDQLKGTYKEASSLSACDPVIYVGNLTGGTY
jgi:hypothetical protein